MIVGIDEVGRGAWAGPLVVGAVLLGGAMVDGLTDSKKLSKKQRELLDIEIRQRAISVGLGWVSAKDIDRIGLGQALKLASRRALAHVRYEYHEIIIDGTIALINDPRVVLMKKADLLVPSVSAASIVAKVARDKYMKQIDTIFPGYKFSEHVGYGTAVHRAAIATLGVTPLHRLSFAPLLSYSLASPAPSSISKQTNGSSRRFEQNKAVEQKRTSKQIGDRAEDEAANYLVRRSHEILARN